MITTISVESLLPIKMGRNGIKGVFIQIILVNEFKHGGNQETT